MVKYYKLKEIEKMGEELNKIFTGFQKLDKKISNWEPLAEKTNEKWKLLKIQQQILENKRATNWFIILSITNILILVITFYLNFQK